MAQTFNFSAHLPREHLKANHMAHQVGHILTADGKEEGMVGAEELLAGGIADHNGFIL